MFCFELIFSVLLMVAAFTSAFKFPTNIKRCLYSDSICLSGVITNILSTHHKGVPALNIPQFDPLQGESLVFDRIPGDLVDANIHFKAFNIIGLSDGLVRNVTGFTKEASNLVFVRDRVLSQITLTGPCSVDGRMFNLPVSGSGNCKITFDSMRVVSKSKCSTRKRHGRVYLNVDEIDLDLTPLRVTFVFENLCNGDKVQSEKINQWLNLHWKQVFSEMKTSFEKTFGEIGRPIVNGPFTVIPYDELFLRSK